MGVNAAAEVIVPGVLDLLDVSVNDDLRLGDLLRGQAS